MQMIKTQQLPQEEVERFTKESKALTTAVSVVGAVVLCFLPLALTVLSYAFELNLGLTNSFVAPWIRTFGMLNSTVNSLLNSLIYCWRQKGMRRFVLSNFARCSTYNSERCLTYKRKNLKVK